MLLYQRAEDSRRRLEARLTTRENTIHSALFYAHGMLAELQENSGLYVNPYREHEERLRMALSCIDLSLQRVQEGYACAAVVFCCRACEALWFMPVARPPWWRLRHPLKSYDELHREQRFQYWVRLEHANEQSAVELWKNTSQMVSAFAVEPLREIAVGVVDIGEAIISADSELCAKRFVSLATKVADLVGYRAWVNSAEHHSYWLEYWSE
jgi:hypothetical protein